MRKTRVAWAVAVLLFVGGTAGCGSRVAPAGVAAPPTTVVQDVAPLASESAAAPAAPPPATPGDAAAAEAQPSAAPTYDYKANHNNGYFRIDLSAECVTPGTPMTITFTGPANGGLAATVAYSDEDPHGNMIAGNADASGRYVWRIVVGLDVPPGPAKVLATMTDWTTRSATADKLFRVVATVAEC